ncbi:MAG TPA: folylpolyglutamate synthase/dihydrofolate synthase family protein, partial [Candidatus Methylomirabilis sp.]|nr:folylpolyglutamate synthase/dihydrofolate synthase family protein [Candidatus Methylomirabilis sp.]
MTYAEATEFLFGLRRFGWRPGLATVRHLLELLGNPHRTIPSLHVAGTNGKGSTAAMLSAILRAAGYRTGLYTSPHLLDFTERIRVNGSPISPAEVTELTASLREVCAAHFDPQPVPNPPAGSLPYPTFFELTTAMAFLHFASQPVEAAVIEVGLGGRLDATNVITPQVAVVTNISLEHQEYLGRTVREIAGEKAGIIKPGVPVVTATSGEALSVIRRVADEQRAALVSVREEYTWTIRESGLDGQVFDVEGPVRRYEAMQLSLAGRHQTENAVTAIAASEALARQGFRLDETTIRRGLVEMRWPGRLQFVGQRPRILLDGAHNPAGAEALAAFLTEHRDDLHRLILVFGVLRDKDWEAMLRLLGPLADQTILTHPPTDRGAEPRDLVTADHHCRKLAIATEPGEGLALALSVAGPEDTILVTGSL